MKNRQAVLATTALDSQGERISLEGLKGMVETVKKHYIPLGVEHDPRIAPLGRVESVEIRQRDDGEHELFGILAVFDPGENPPILDGRTIVCREPSNDWLTISSDWNHRHAEDQKDLKEVALLLGAEQIYDVKKAAEPISIISIAMTYIPCRLLEGFLTKIGADAWDLAKEKLAQIFLRKENRKGEQLLNFQILGKLDGYDIEVTAILVNPDQDDIDQFIKSGLPIIDEAIPLYLKGNSDIRKLVFEFKERKLMLKFAVRRDCVALSAMLSPEDLIAASHS